MQEKLSIIIPTLNEKKNIKNCLTSLLNQTEKPYEIIIVDNGSTDNTKEIAKKLEKKFEEKGTIIGSLDADAVADKNWVSVIIKNFKDQKIVGIGGKSKFRNKGKIFNFFYISIYYLKLLGNLYCLGGGNSAFRKSAFISVKGYEGL